MANQPGAQKPDTTKGNKVEPKTKAKPPPTAKPGRKNK